MTKQEKIIVSAYTGVLMCDFDDVHEYIQKKLGRPVYTHELADKGIQKEVKEKSHEDFLEICNREESEQNWIPCSKRLPEYNESVLTWDGYVFCIEKRIPYIRDDDGEPIEGDWWVGDEYDEYESECYPNLRDGAAIAWMPIPPYSGGDVE